MKADLKAMGRMMHRPDLEAAERRMAALPRPLYPFQAEGVRWLVGRRDAILADPMGMGKTAQALVAAPACVGVLVVCPASAKGTWAAETPLWREDLKVVVLRGRGSFRYPERGELVILNYDILPATPPPGCPPRVVLIADEAHLAKNAKATRTRRLRALGQVVHQAGGRRWGLTATPLLNTPPELRTVLRNFDLAAAVGIEKFNYLKLAFNGRMGRWGHSWGLPKPAVVRLLKTVMLRRNIDDVLPELPPLRHQVHQVNGIDATTRALLASVMAELEAAGLTLDDILSAESRADDAVQGGRLLFQRISEARMALATAKVGAMLEQVSAFEAAEEPLVVFSAHKAPIKALAGRTGWGVITSDTPPEKRTALVDAFQAGILRGLGCTIKTGGLSLTMTRAAHALFVDLAWTPSDNSQAEGRLRRIGQKASAIIIHRLEVNHPLDERVNEVLRVKARLVAATITPTEVGHPPATPGGD